MKTISVIIPVYKVEAYIEETIKSLIRQTYKDFELLLIDDGSPDRSAQIAESILSTSDIVFEIIHTENRGVSAARNLGLEKARGEYVIMIDGDDTVADDFLSTYAALLSDFPQSEVYSTSFTVYSDESIIKQPKLDDSIKRYSRDESLIAFYRRRPRFLLPTLLLSREFINKNHLRFDEGVRYSEDVQFIWRVLAFNNNGVVHSSYSGYQYILHAGSTMTASGVKKILTWCSGFDKLDKDIHRYLPEEIRDSFVPMSFFAMLHGASKMLSFQSFRDVFNEADCASNLHSPNARIPFGIKMVSKLTTFCPRLGYLIMKHF